jgi:Transposase IS200 like
MPWGLERWHGGHDLHFLTFSCYRRQPWLASVSRRDLFVKVLEQARQRYQWVVVGYVVMPEHIHLLVSEPGGPGKNSAKQMNIGCPIQPSFGWVGILTFTSRGEWLACKTAIAHPAKPTPEQTQLGWGTLRMLG